MFEMSVQELIDGLRARPVATEAVQNLKRILAEIGVDEVYFCRYVGCGQPFVAKKAGQVYCSGRNGRCSSDDWNVFRRKEQI